MVLKLIHIINICAVLLSTVGVTSYRHYCQENLKSISFFANLTEPCYQPKSSQKKNKKQQKDCCSQSKTYCKPNTEPLSTFSTAKITKNCDSKQNQHFDKLSARKDSSNNNSNKTSFKKKVCCLDESNYAQSDILSSAVASDNFIVATPLILPTPISAIAFTPVSYPKQIYIYSSVTYSQLGFFPPKYISLHILYESFLC